LYRLAREGHLPVRRIGRRLVISERLLDQWIDSVGDVRATEYPGASLVDRHAHQNLFVEAQKPA
jgi:hypothetical protein